MTLGYERRTRPLHPRPRVLPAGELGVELPVARKPTIPWHARVPLEVPRVIPQALDVRPVNVDAVLATRIEAVGTLEAFDEVAPHEDTDVDALDDRNHQRQA